MISDDLRKYKKILLLTNAHLECYHPAGVINVGRGKKSAKLSPLISQVPMAGVSNSGYAVHGKKIVRLQPGHYITNLKIDSYFDFR